jgi:hypothetical protein
MPDLVDLGLWVPLHSAPMRSVRFSRFEDDSIVIEFCLDDGNCGQSYKIRRYPYPAQTRGVPPQHRQPPRLCHDSDKIKCG